MTADGKAPDKLQRYMAGELDNIEKKGQKMADSIDGKFEQSEIPVDKEKSLQPEFEINVYEYLRSADEALKKGSYGDAIADYCRAIRKEKDNAMAQQKLGMAFVKFGVDSAAMGCLEKAYELNPNMGHKAKYELARLLYEKKDFSKAALLAENAINKLHPNAGKYLRLLRSSEQKIGK